MPARRGARVPPGASPEAEGHRWLLLAVTTLLGAAVIAPTVVQDVRPASSSVLEPAAAPVPVLDASEPDPDRPQLLWSDEFDGPAGAGVDRSRWVPELGAGGWGNGELQAYTDRPENLALDGEGHLRITLREETTTDERGNTAAFTSARLKTVQATDVGRLEARMRVPAGTGLWSAFWTLGASHDVVGWPRSGELDVMEVYDRATAVESVVHAAQLGPAGEPVGKWREVTELPVAGGLSDAWHVYAVDITPDLLVFSLDGQVHLQVARDERAAGEEWPFDQPQYVLLNLAMARWGQAPPEPASLLVDYVRAYPPTG